MLKSIARSLRVQAACLPWRILAASGVYHGEGPAVRFVIEKADWAIRWVGEHVRDEIEPLAPGLVQTTVTPQRIANRVVHFGSQYMWLVWGPHMARTNRYVTSFFHGKPEDGPEVARHIEQFLSSVPRLARIVTGAGLIEQRLLDWGVPPDKVIRIPIGVDTEAFYPPTPQQRTAARAKFGIPEDTIVVGSFQKDGEGWGDGMTPKLIKGPDVFLAAMETLARNQPVMAFLTGPARGFVKQGLERAGIPFVHRYVQIHTDLVACYHALDLYFVTSREEGGPMGLMEGMSSGVPVVSTKVGMAPDLIRDGENGGLANVGDADDIAAHAQIILSLSDLERQKLREHARHAVRVCDWSVVGRRHLEEVYRPLLHHAS